MPISKLLEILAIASASRLAATTAVHFGHQAGPGCERRNAGVTSNADLHSAGIPAPALLPAGAAIARIRHCDWRSEGADDRFTE